MLTKKYQLGLSIIEIMVTLVISSLLLLAVSKVYIDNRRSYLFQQNKSENQENQRYALLLLHQHLTKTGYRRDPSILTDSNGLFPAIPAEPRKKNDHGCKIEFKKGIAVHWDNDNSNNPKSPSLCIRYEPRDTQDRDCLGNLPKSAELAKTYPYTVPKENIVERYWYDKDTKTLNCEAVHYEIKEDTDPAGTEKISSQSGELINQISNLEFEFGLDDCNGGAADGKIDCYKKQADVTNTNDILSIRYTALLKGSNSNVRDSGITVDEALKKWKDTLNIPASDPVLQEIKNADENHLYQVLQGTVALRNILP